METAEIERFQNMLKAGMDQYNLKPMDLAGHNHLRGGSGRRIPRFNDSRAIDCLCRGSGLERKQSVRKLYEHAMEKAGRRSVSATWAHAILCMLHATKKVADWRASRDPGEDDWLWSMDSARLREPWGEPDPIAMDWGLPPIGIPYKSAAEKFAREIARVLANTKNPVGTPWIKRVDEQGVTELLQIFLATNKVELAASFASWYGSACSQFRVTIDDSKREMTALLVREGRKSRTVLAPTGGDPYSIHFAWTRKEPKSDYEPRPEDTLYAFLTHSLEQEARTNEAS
jgi:hypothetical protein